MRNTEALAEQFGVNDEQALALDFKENTALRASAGSGKTRVLTARFVRILLEETDADLDDIVAITFTRKAATVMKDRIHRELAVWLKKPQYANNSRLTDFRLRMSEARIDTIHGFLGELIRQYFQVLGIDPGFTILEEVDTKVLMLRFAEASIRTIFDDASQKERLNSMMTIYGADLAETSLRDAVISLYQGMRGAGDTVQAVRARHSEHESQIAAIDTEKSSVKAGTPSIEPRISSIEPRIMSNTGITTNIGISALEHIGLDLLEQLDNRFRAYKDRENVLDFSDLELLACDLLEKPESCRSIRDSFRHLMMDEFQDVNPLQMRIVNLLIRDGQRAIAPGRLFIVGDSKQSIYGFRGADYRVFGEASELIAKQGSARKLSKCYRCTDAIIDTVNHVFSQLMNAYEPLCLPREKSGRPVELITWTADDRKILKPSNRWASYKELIPDGDPEDADAVLRAPYREVVDTNRMVLQGNVIAGRMAALNAEGIPYRDMAILVPSRTSLAAIENGLYSRDIPYCVLGGLGFWSRPEVADILNLYRLIFQPQDRASFYAVLRSPLFSFADDLLLKCRHIDQEAKDKVLRPEVLLERLADDLSRDMPNGFANEGNNGSDKAKNPDAILTTRAASIFKHLLPLDGLLGPSELFRIVLETTGYPDILLLLPNGEKKIRNLEKLTQVVDEFSRKHGYTARDLPSYMDALQESGGMDSEAFLDNEDSEAVKILTIHASKGLEFPVVFLPSMDRAVDTVGARFKPLLVLHPVNGITAIGVDEDQNASPELNPAYQQVFITRLNRKLEESRRVFYVAATRAQSLLVMIGEHQYAKKGGIDAQNSFMKQLSLALADRKMPDSLICLDAEAFLGHMKVQPDMPIIETLTPDEDAESAGPVSFGYEAAGISDKTRKTEHPIAAEVREYPYKLESRTIPANTSMPPHRPFGLVNVSQWMSWRDCPRQYWLSRIIRMPGQSDVQTALETSNGTNQDSFKELFQESFQEETEDPSEEMNHESYQDPSLDSTTILADPDLMIDAARLGTWIHAQLQDIPLDRSGSFPVLGRCDLNKIRIPSWLENQRQHALHLLEGYNRIIGNVAGNPSISAGNPSISAGNQGMSARNQGIHNGNTAISDENPETSERLVCSWSEFEFRIKASDSLELIGVIDRLDIVETKDGFRAVITDHKSNHIQNEQSMLEKASYYAIQLQVYAWAISRMPIWRGMPVEVIRGELYFLDAGQSAVVRVDPDQQASAVDSLIQALPDLLGLLKEEGYPMKEGDACTWCQHRKICEMLNAMIPA
jgi:ATP-dependent helicase/nuclease subunit A